MDSEFVQSLAKGLAVIEAFTGERPALTLSEAARITGISRAAARRLLHTLVELGYAGFDGKRFSLRPKVLDLGFAFLHSQGVWHTAQPFMVELVEQVRESCSAAVLDGTDIVYVARVPVQARIMSISLGLGSRLPAHATSMGRVLLAALTDAELDALLARLGPLERYTEHTVTDPGRLRERIAAVRRDGYAISDQELELGLRSVAVPVRGAEGRVVAALNVGTHASRTTMQAVRTQILPRLRETATRISQALGAPRTERPR
ncbi:MAG: helix-turn-helix domain-containing protein [Burkholderiales bacterium]|nr:MAG: helix-turn-helix domain-containing protein [Burkholderiales bacterium]